MHKRLLSIIKVKAAETKDIFLIQQLEEVLTTVVSRVQSLEIDEVNILDGGDGQALPRHIASFPAMVRQVLQEVHATTGVDVTGILSGAKSKDQQSAGQQLLGVGDDQNSNNI